ncbi:hypothetical protein C8R43DRAFT_1235201 [Mycena crocata]|nr:hypothetical protein C8R43DRAFT_1235201 [Mycena crocata]
MPQTWTLDSSPSKDIASRNANSSSPHPLPIIPSRRVDKNAPTKAGCGGERARQRVVAALNKLLPPALLITYDLLQVGAAMASFVPIPGLSAAASLLLDIWDNAHRAKTNQVQEAGTNVETDMSEPLQKLTETFTQVHDCLLRQVERSFLQRYLKREEILCEITDCNSCVDDALSLFTISAQLRILKEVKNLKDQYTPELEYTLDLGAESGLSTPLPEQSTSILGDNSTPTQREDTSPVLPRRRNWRSSSQDPEKARHSGAYDAAGHLKIPARARREARKDCGICEEVASPPVRTL